MVHPISAPMTWYHSPLYRIAGIIHGGLIFVFFTMERIHENNACEICHVCAWCSVHLQCADNNPTNKFRNTLIYGYMKIYHHEKYLLYVTLKIRWTKAGKAAAVACFTLIINTTCNTLVVNVHVLYVSATLYMYIHALYVHIWTFEST